MAIDSYGRRIDYLRISLTDRCNLRCVYCMPEEGLAFKPHEDILSFEEIERFASIAVREGIGKIRLTGGEPLVRHGVVDHVRRLKAITGLEAIALTTNATLLPKFARDLHDAGLTRVNISLDSLDPEVYSRMTRHGKLEDALAGIDAAFEAGFSPDQAQRRGGPLARPGPPRLRTYDPRAPHPRALHRVHAPWATTPRPMSTARARPPASTGRAPTTSPATSSSRPSRPGERPPASARSSRSPATRPPAVGDRRATTASRTRRAPSASSARSRTTSAGECNRLRLTADGKLRTCLFSDDEIDVREVLRNGTDAEVHALIQSVRCTPSPKATASASAHCAGCPR
jgi:GTP 3',8-cyclase